MRKKTETDRCGFHARRFRTGYLVVVAAAMLAAAAGCARAPEIRTQPILQEAATGAEVGLSSPDEMERRLRKEAGRWLGIPYQMGASGPLGMDCSGLAVRIFKNLFHIDLPRTTKEQARVGNPVPQNRLQPADLVFFRIPGKKNCHVGVYLGQGEFVHASSSQGVVISAMETPYWEKAYWISRRILLSGH